MALKIMVVDDEPSVLDIIKALMDPLGCEVATFQDSRNAARTVKSQKFDGIFVDARMPHLDGFQLTQCIRESPLNGKVPVVMLTGNDDVETMRKGFKAGITIFLGKPVTQERIARAVNALRGAFLREKRKYVRVAFSAPVTCRWHQKGPQRVAARGQDVSVGGMALVEAPPLTKGQEMEVEFSLPGSTATLKLKSRVVRELPNKGLGIEFVNTADIDRAAVQRYITGAILG